MEALVRPEGVVTLAGQLFRAALGRAGVSTGKREGDFATPAGLLPLRRVLYRADRIAIPACAVARAAAIIAAGSAGSPEAKSVSHGP